MKTLLVAPLVTILGSCASPSLLQEQSSWQGRTLALVIQPRDGGDLVYKQLVTFGQRPQIPDRLADPDHPTAHVVLALAALAEQRYGVVRVPGDPLQGAMPRARIRQEVAADLLLKVSAGNTLEMAPQRNLPLYTIQHGTPTYVHTSLGVELIDVHTGRTIRKDHCEQGFPGKVYLAENLRAAGAALLREVLNRQRDACLALFEQRFFDARGP